jgi:hypothetical protein
MSIAADPETIDEAIRRINQSYLAND